MNPQRCKWLWTLALLVMTANALVVMWRLPVQKNLANDADEQAVQDAAQWIARLPAGTRLLLLASDQDKTYFHFHTRLIYFLYPHRIDIILNHLPPDAAAHYDGILGFGRMAPVLQVKQSVAVNDWQLAGRDPRAAFIVSPRYAHAAPYSLPTHRLPLPVRLLSGLFSMATVVVLGALLLRLTLRAPPFASWWANLAVAHLVGATAFAVIQQLCILLAGKPLVWPVYVLLAIMFIESRFERRNCCDGGDGMNSFATRLRRSVLRTRKLLFNRVMPEGHLAERHTAKEFIPSRSSPPSQQSRPSRLYLAALLLGIVTALERMWLIGLDWDALAIWQLKAKMLFLDGNLAAWQNTSPFPYAHFDYPLLTPLLTWWTYRHFDGVDLHWAQANGLLFYADLLIIFGASAIRAVPMWAALSATALLSGLPEVTLHAVSGYADLPLSAYLLGAGVFLCRALIERETELWPLVGWMLAGVILVKNEGLLACVSTFVVIGWHFYRDHRAASSLSADNTQIKGTDLPVDVEEISKRAPLRASLWWLLLPILAYLPWWLLNHHWNLTNDVMQPAHPPHFTTRLLWWRMWYAMVYGFGKQLLWLGPWFPAWGLFGIVALAGGAAMYGRRIALARPLWLLAGLQTVGYIGIYMITPAALPAHIISSVDRLLLHIAPTLLLAALSSCFAEEKVQENNAVQTPAKTE